MEHVNEVNPVNYSGIKIPSSLEDLYDDDNKENTILFNGSNRLQSKTENWELNYKSHRILPDVKYQDEIPIIEVKSKFGYTKLSSIGGILTIKGKPKSRKTFFLSLIVANFLKTSSNNDIFKITIPDGKSKILFFDTEQSNSEAQLVFDRVRNQVNSEALDNLIVLGLRTMSPKQRIEFIEETIQNISGVFLVIIDGIRDLVSDINNADEATFVLHKLMKWTGEGQLHLINVIHQNKGDNNPRGHLGSELVNKSQSMIEIEKKNEVSVVRPTETRSFNFDSFAFGVNEYGTPYLIDGYVEKSRSNNSEKKNPEELDIQIHIQLLNEILRPSSKYGKVELSNLLKNRWLQDGYVISDVASTRLVNYYVSTGIIRKLGFGRKDKYVLC